MFALTRSLLRYRPPSRRMPPLSATTHHLRRANPHASEPAVDAANTVAAAQVISSTSWKQKAAAYPPNAAAAPSSAAQICEGSAFQQETGGVSPLPSLQFHQHLLKPIILDDIHDTYAISPSQQVDGHQLWSQSRVLRNRKHLRHRNAACVVGGASAIRRIWRTYKIRPTVVYVPNTEPDVPPWCVEATLPTVIVRCSPVAVKRQLLSAEYSDGFAAEFALPPQHVMDASALLHVEEGDVPATAASAGVTVSLDRQVQAMLVLVGLRIPSNVGALLRAAAEMGYDSAVLVNCVDATQEKVLRASDGTALSPALHLYETEASGQDCVTLLSHIAAKHYLMPFLAVPSQEVDPAFEVAKRFHAYNNQRASGETTGAEDAKEGGLRAALQPRLGAMVVLGSEAQGLHELHGKWAVPYQLVTLPLPNPMVDSYNVSVAGSVLLHLFRPKAAAHFERLLTLSGETTADLLPSESAAAEDDDEEDMETEKHAVS